MKKVSETISGMLPLKERNKLNGLLSGKNFDTIVVESCRALSRSVETSEQIFKTAKQNGVNIVSSDIPSLFRVDGNPATNFIRRVMAAVTDGVRVGAGVTARVRVRVRVSGRVRSRVRD